MKANLLFKRILMILGTLLLISSGAVVGMTLGMFGSSTKIQAEKIIEDDDEEESTTTGNYEIKIQKIMKNTQGYKPGASDTFTVTFTQLDNLGKYWGKADEADTVIAPKIDQALSPATIAGSGATGELISETKTVSTNYSINDLKTPGYYTYKITEGALPEAISDANGSRSWTHTGTDESYIMTVKVDEEGNKDVKIKKESDLSTKLDTVTFTNSLTATQNVTIKKVLAGSGLTASDKSKKYDIKVTLNGLTSDVKAGDITFSNGKEQTVKLGNNETVTITNVPVGATVGISEDGLSGFVASVKRDTVSVPETGKLSDGVTMTKDAGTVAMGTTASNSFTVTNTRDDIVNTGIKVATNPFVILLAVIGIGGVAYVVIKRKVKKSINR
ncbi:hypothetical protein GKC34_05445 [Lactobacillus salivarius]|uniref:DUF7601 domain-containing protein n=2 Tax=Bacilli TaxID=91061 RepID=A0A6A8LRM6_9LACO|nr:hypothetical protein [Ligilactobacillus salivarius]